MQYISSKLELLFVLHLNKSRVYAGWEEIKAFIRIESVQLERIVTDFDLYER